MKDDSISSSSESDEIVSLHKNKKVHYRPRTMAFFSKSFSASDDESEKITNKKEKSHNPHYRYRYKNCSKDFSADTCTSDFDNLFSSFSYSSDFSSD